MGDQGFRVQAVGTEAVLRPAAVDVIELFVHCSISVVTHARYQYYARPTCKSGGNEDEAAAMTAMFQAQSANWEETREKMSQLVSPLALFFPCYIVFL